MFNSFIDPGSNAGVGLLFTDRTGGHSTGPITGFNLGRTDVDELEALRANMADLRAGAGITAIAVAHQVHGTTVLDVDADPGWQGDRWLGDRIPGAAALPVADALITTTPKLGLAIRVADCVPVLFADPVHRVVAAAHAGRRGLLDGVLVRTVEEMRKRGASRITAWIGPHICGDCYEVPRQMAVDADALIPGVASTSRWGTSSIDLGLGARIQLSEAGVSVVGMDPCTLTTETLYSHRGDQSAAGRQTGLIWLG